MPTFDEHSAQALHNRQFAQKIKSDKKLKYGDWLVTVSFYSVIHLVEALIFVNRKLYIPEETNCRYEIGDKRRAVSGIKHSNQLHDEVKSGSIHDLRSLIIQLNESYFKQVGESCIQLRRQSQAARYQCQQIDDDEALDAFQSMMDAHDVFNNLVIRYTA